MAKKKTKKSTKKATIKKKVAPKKSPDVPATQAMIYELREEMKSSISSLENKIDSKLVKIDAKIDSKFKSMDANFDKVLAEVHRIGLMVEEQNARNKYVLDGYTSLNDRVERLEKKVYDENM